LLLLFLQEIEDPADREKFQRIYERYRREMFYVASRLLADPRDVEDAVQEAFFALSRNLRKLRNPEDRSSRAYILLTAERKAIDILRRQRPELLTADIEELAGYQPDVLPDDTMARLILALPQALRTVAVLRYALGYKPREIARRLELTPAEVSRRLYRAKQILTQKWKEETEDADG